MNINLGQYIFCICGPSGSGKSTIIKKLIENYPDYFQLYKTTVDRPKRDSEINTEFSTYNFISPQKFDELVAMNQFYEWERQPHNNNRYGKAKDTFKDLSNDKVILTEMRIPKAIAFKNELSQYNVQVFYLIIKDEEKVKIRLLQRGDALEVIEHRMETVREEEEKESRHADILLNSYDHNLEKTIEDLIEIMKTKFKINIK